MRITQYRVKHRIDRFIDYEGNIDILGHGSIYNFQHLSCGCLRYSITKPVSNVILCLQKIRKENATRITSSCRGGGRPQNKTRKKSIDLILKNLKAGTHEATNRCKTLLQRIALCVQSSDKSYALIEATEFCRCNMSPKFKARILSM